MARAEKKQNVAVRGNSNGDVALTDDMLRQLIADSGAGLSSAAEDNLIPIILLMQDMTPEVKKRDPSYIEGAEAGMFMCRATKQLWAGDKAMAERTGLPQLEFQHCWLDKAIAEWVPRTEGGGFVARHPLTTADVDAVMRKLGGRQVRVPGDTRPNWQTEDGNELIETRYHFGHVINNDRPQPAVLPFSSTGHTTSKQWMTLANGFKEEVVHPDTGEVLIITMPGYSRRYIIGSKARANKKGNFFVATVEDGGKIESASIKQMGKQLCDSAMAGNVKAGIDEPVGDGRGASDEI